MANSILHHSISPGVWLKQKFLERQEARPSLSMRAFAKRLQLSPGHLANLISGKRHFTTPAAKKIAEHLELSPGEREEFFSVISFSAKKKKISATDGVPEVSSHFIDDDQFKLISDWYNFGVLSLISVKGASSDTKWIAETLGITVQEAAASLVRLEKLGLLQIEDEKLVPVVDYVHTPSNVPSSALRQHHRQILGRAEKAIDHVHVERRHYESTTLAIASDDLPVLKRAITEFQNTVKNIVGTTRDKDMVYTMSVQFFPSNLR